MCKEEVSPEHEQRSSSLAQEGLQPPQHEERSSSLGQEEPQPPQIKEEAEEADGTPMALQIDEVWSYAPSGKNFIATDVKTLMFWFWRRLLENFS